MNSKSSRIFFLPFVTFALFLGGCGNSNRVPSATRNVDEFAANAGLGTINCDGQGTKFSGEYNLKLTAVKFKCSVKYNFEADETGTTMNCTQKDKDFACQEADEADALKLSGCISKNGAFKLSFEDPVKEKGVTRTGFMVGTLGKADGKLELHGAAQNDDEKIECHGTANAELSATSD